MSEAIRESSSELFVRDLQDQFAALLGVDPTLLRNLRICPSCNGHDYQWTDHVFSNLALEISPEDNQDWAQYYQDYRAYLAESRCMDCDATGFENGDFQLSTNEWLNLAA